MTNEGRGADIALKRIKLRNICAEQLFNVVNLSVDFGLIILNKGVLEEDN